MGLVLMDPTSKAGEKEGLVSAAEDATLFRVPPRARR